MKEKILIILAVLFLLTTIFRIHITVNTKMKEEPFKDDMTYWTEDINPRDGFCKCPGGTMCYSCQNEATCKCKITRLDLLDARRRYEAVRSEFDKVLGSSSLGD